MKSGKITTKEKAQRPDKQLEEKSKDLRKMGS